MEGHALDAVAAKDFQGETIHSAQGTEFALNLPF
jgi:hypothetical protein